MFSFDIINIQFFSTMKSVIKFIFLLLIVQSSVGQSNTLPQDYLPIEFHKSRREALRSKLPKTQ